MTINVPSPFSFILFLMRWFTLRGWPSNYYSWGEKKVFSGLSLCRRATARQIGDEPMCSWNDICGRKNTSHLSTLYLNTAPDAPTALRGSSLFPESDRLNRNFFLFSTLQPHSGARCGSWRRFSMSFKADRYLFCQVPHMHNQLGLGLEQEVEERKHRGKSEHGRIFYLTSTQEGKQQWAGMW